MKKIAFLFPGQGSQYVGMGKTLCDKYSIAKETFKEANEILGYDLKKICFKGPHDKLSDTVNTQPAILTATVAAFRVFTEEFSIEPDLAVGHSFGAMSALVCSEAIKFSDALKISRKKGEYAKTDPNSRGSAMIAVEGVKKDELKKICAHASKTGGGAYIGIINSPKQIVVSGEEKSVAAVEKELLKTKARIERLYISAPFHTPLLISAAEKTKKDLLKLKIGKPKWPILSSISIKRHKDAKEIINDLYLDLVEPTNWLDTVKYLVKNKFNTCIEIGPKAVLKKIVENTTDKIETHSFISPKDLEPMKTALKLDKESKIEILIAVLRIFASTPNHNDSLEEFEKGAAEPYRDVKNLRLKLQEKDREPTLEEAIWALGKLKSIIDTKQLERVDRKERLMDEVFDVYDCLLHIPRVKEMFRDDLA